MRDRQIIVLGRSLPQPDDDMIERAASELALIEKARRILTAALRPTPEDQAGES